MARPISKTIKVQMADDIRMIQLNPNGNFEQLVFKSKEAFPGKLGGEVPVTFKYTDAVGDPITVFDTQSLQFARTNFPELKLSVSDNGGVPTLALNSEQVGLIRNQLHGLKRYVCTEVDRLLEQLGDKGAAPPEGVLLVTPPVTPLALQEDLVEGLQAMALGLPTADKPAWHSSSALNEAVNKFHNQLCKQPEMKRAKEVHTRYMRDIIETGLKQIGRCARLEFTGSSYEGVKVEDRQKLEFDVMIMMKGRDIQTSPVEPGYVILTPKLARKEDPQFQDIIDQRGNISTELLANLFFGQIQKLVNGHKELTEKVKLRKHGPAVQMDVYEDGKIWFSVDLVPAYDIPGKDGMERYVAKPLKDYPDNAWRRSFSGEEKELLNSLDKGNIGCRKQCLRILKVMREKGPVFHILTSYHLKTVLFHECAEKSDNELWQPIHLAERVLDLMGRLCRSINKNSLPHYFLPEINLLKDIPQKSRENMRDRLRRLRNKEEQFKKFIAVNK